MRRRTLLTGGSSALLAAPAIAQDQRAGTLRFVLRGSLLHQLSPRERPGGFSLP